MLTVWEREIFIQILVVECKKSVGIAHAFLIGNV